VIAFMREEHTKIAGSMSPGHTDPTNPAMPPGSFAADLGLVIDEHSCGLGHFDRFFEDIIQKHQVSAWAAENDDSEDNGTIHTVIWKAWSYTTKLWTTTTGGKMI
jgi:hypothetical protein